MKISCIVSFCLFSALPVSAGLTPSTATKMIGTTDGARTGAGTMAEQSWADAGRPTATVPQTFTEYEPGTTVVIIVSVSLALLVCALIPLIFYGRWRTNQGTGRADRDTVSTGEDGVDCYDERDKEQDRTSIKQAVGPPHVGLYVDPAACVSVPAQYDSVHRGIDPKTLDHNSGL